MRRSRNGFTYEAKQKFLFNSKEWVAFEAEAAASYGPWSWEGI